jgi:DNA-binding protein HU-beta
MAKKEAPQGLNKAGLARAVWERHGGLSQAESRATVGTVLATLKEALEQKGRVSVQNFGTFSVLQRQERRGVDPNSGKPIQIASRREVGFRPAQKLARDLTLGKEDSEK